MRFVTHRVASFGGSTFSSHLGDRAGCTVPLAGCGAPPSGIYGLVRSVGASPITWWPSSHSERRDASVAVFGSLRRSFLRVFVRRPGHMRAMVAKAVVR